MNLESKKKTAVDATSPLQTRAMIAKLNISRWTAVQADKRVSDQIAVDNGADPRMGRYIKRLIKGEALHEIGRIRGQARRFHYAHTLPWSDNGERILPAKVYLEYMTEMRKLQRQFERAVKKFVTNYPGYVREAKKLLGGLFNPDQYYAPDEVSKQFAMKLEICGLPSAEDFRVDLGAEDTARVKADIERQLNESVQGAVIDIWQRVHDHVAHLTQKLKDYEVQADGAIKNPFRDSTIENLKELAELLPHLNVTGSAELDAMSTRLTTELTAVDAETLRTDAGAREAVAKKAEAIVKETVRRGAKAPSAEAMLKDVADFIS
jgi:hypothetical protein